jgi:hypothetical protein
MRNAISLPIPWRSIQPLFRNFAAGLSMRGRAFCECVSADELEEPDIGKVLECRQLAIKPLSSLAFNEETP